MLRVTLLILMVSQQIGTGPMTTRITTWIGFQFDFLQGHCHARGDGGALEWPPSPLRLFQALVAAAAHRWGEQQRLAYAVPALRWLETLPPPEIFAPAGVPARTFVQFYVPDNSADEQVPQWKKGVVEAMPRRSEKIVRPTQLPNGDRLTFVFAVPAEQEAALAEHWNILEAAVRHVPHLGWGIDQVVGRALRLNLADLEQLPGFRYRPATGGETALRVPIPGTLQALQGRHEAFLGRIDGQQFRPAPALGVFGMQSYECAVLEGSTPRPWVAFSILDPQGERYRAFGTARHTMQVAGWVRNATGQICTGWPYQDPRQFVHGDCLSEAQAPAKGPNADARFAFLPLPTIEHRAGEEPVVGDIRRVLIVAPPGAGEEIAWIRRRLAAQELTREGETTPIGMLNLLPHSDWVLNQYVRTRRRPLAEDRDEQVWSTVTPVILPGHDDGDQRKTENLLRKALGHAGLTPEFIAATGIEFRGSGFRRGVDLASRYEVPDNLEGKRVHVRLTFPRPLSGPLAIGKGRYRGFGLFAMERNRPR